MMPPLRVAPGVPNGCPMSPILAPHPLDLPETPHSEWADSWTNRTGPETSRPFYMGGFMDEPDRPRNLTPFLYGRIHGRTGQARKPHVPFTSVFDDQPDRLRDVTPFYMGGSLDEPDSFTLASRSARSAGNWSSVGKSGSPDRLDGDPQENRGARTAGFVSF